MELAKCARRAQVPRHLTRCSSTQCYTDPAGIFRFNNTIGIEFGANKLMTTDDVFKEIYESGKDAYKIAVMPEMKIESTGDFFNRVNRCVELGNDACKKECFVEFISFLMLYLEVWMRIYLVGKGKYDSKMNIYSDKCFFGDLIKKCEKENIDSSIANELNYINNIRRDYIHGFLKSIVNEHEVPENINRIKTLANRLYNYVVNEVGLKIDSSTQVGNRGDIVVSLRNV